MIAIVVSVLVADVVIAGGVVETVNDRLVASDASYEPGVAQPTSPYRSGSPASLAPWTTLGRMGRSFVAGAPSVDELTAFNDSPAVPPIRVYVGLQSAASVRERAELAVAELERTGAFDRDILIVATPTGTGSVNRYSTTPLEYMYNGNTAAVAVQYSYLPSWVVMAGNQDRAATTARALFEAVERRLASQPTSERPLLLLYGESLGSFGSEQIFSDLVDMRGRVDGVLWVGPPRANRLWRQLTADRDPRSPVWQPVYEDGAAVRFGANGADLLELSSHWTAPRIAFLQHGSDPVTWWSPDLLFRRPAWLEGRRPRDISDRMPYVPVVTFLQTTIDTVLGGNAPMHYGHIYATEQAEAWSAIAPPRHWSSSDTLRLVSALAN